MRLDTLLLAVIIIKTMNLVSTRNNGCCICNKKYKYWLHCFLLYFNVYQISDVHSLQQHRLILHKSTGKVCTKSVFIEICFYPKFNFHFSAQSTHTCGRRSRKNHPRVYAAKNRFADSRKMLTRGKPCKVCLCLLWEERPLVEISVIGNFKRYNGIKVFTSKTGGIYFSSYWSNLRSIDETIDFSCVRCFPS